MYGLHGMLHLCGLDDRNEVDFAHMHHREDEILKRLGVGAVFHSLGGSKVAANGFGEAKKALTPALSRSTGRGSKRMRANATGKRVHLPCHPNQAEVGDELFAYCGALSFRYLASLFFSTLSYALRDFLGAAWGLA